MANPRLVLASTSRYRKDLLARLGLPFDVMAPGVDEAPLPAERPGATAARLAEAKARTVAQAIGTGLVIGSDQVADLGGRAIGKPADRRDAVRLLEALSGRTVVFHTAVALVNAATGRIQRDRVDVASTFRPLPRHEIEAYVDREQPLDCAGAVKSEALGIVLFDRIASDDPTALIGLPLIALSRMLRAEGVDLFAR
jgi:septum formation protein